MSVPVGIDFGGSFSCVGAYVGDHVEVISGNQGNRMTPSLVAVEAEEVLIGELEALAQSHRNPAGTLTSFKRLLGRSYAEVEEEGLARFPFKVINQGSLPAVETPQGEGVRVFTPVELTGMVLDKMRRTAEEFLQQPVREVVLSSPAYFSPREIAALEEGARAANLSPLKVLPEPLAACMAYGLPQKGGEGGRFLVLNVGASSTEAAVVGADNGLLQLLSSSGERSLGGDDFDARLVEHFAAEFKRKNKLDVAESKRSLRKLRNACEKTKCILSTNAQATLQIDSLHEGVDFHSSITRARFEDLCTELLKRVTDHIPKVLLDAKLEKSQIDEVVLVGGSCRIPKLQQMVSDFFEGKEVLKSINPEEAVAIGTTFQAAALSGVPQSVKESAPQELVPLSLGVETLKGVLTTVIKRKSTYPTKRSVIFSTINNGQQSVMIRVFEGERVRTRHCKLIAQFELPVTPRPRGIPHIEVSLEINAEGVLTVTATDQQTQETDFVEVKKYKSHFTPQYIEEAIVSMEACKSEAPLPPLCPSAGAP